MATITALSKFYNSTILDIQHKAAFNDFERMLKSDVNEKQVASKLEGSFAPPLQLNERSNVDMRRELFKQVPKYDFIVNQSNKEFFLKVKKWVCTVTSLSEDIFLARADEVGVTGTYEEVEFDINDVSPDDREYLKIGSVFYWTIGYNTRNGQKTKQSVIRFKRLPQITEKDFDEIYDKAHLLSESINWETD